MTFKGPCQPELFMILCSWRSPSCCPSQPFLIQLQMGFGIPNPVPTYSVFLHSCWVTCPYSHLLYTSFLCLHLVRSSSASGLLPSLLHLLFVRMDHSWAWRVIPEKQPALLDHSSLQKLYPMGWIIPCWSLTSTAGPRAGQRISSSGKQTRPSSLPQFFITFFP